MKNTCFALLLLLPLLSTAQSNYKPGYVVTLQGDTLRGLVNYREWDYTPKYIDFKATLNDKGRQLGTSDINCFEIDGLETYKGYNVKISMDVLTLRNLSAGIDTNSKTEPVFLKILQTGKNVTLYGYTDLIKTRYYIKASSEAKPSELIYKQYLDQETVNTVITVDTYHRQLTSVALVLGINNLSNQIQRTRYTAVDLMAVVSKLNGTSELAVANTTTPAISNWRLFAGVALNISTLKYDGDSPFPNASGTSTLPAANLGFDFFVNPTVGRLIIRVEAGFAINNYTATSVTNSPFGYGFSTLINTSKVNQYNVLLTPQVIYNVYNTKQFKAFLGVGFRATYSTYSTNQEITNYGSFSITTNNFPQLVNLHFNVPFKAGVTLNNRLEIYGSFVPSSLITNQVGFSGYINSYAAGVNYLFGNAGR